MNDCSSKERTSQIPSVSRRTFIGLILGTLLELADLVPPRGRCPHCAPTSTHSGVRAPYRHFYALTHPHVRAPHRHSDPDLDGVSALHVNCSTHPADLYPRARNAHQPPLPHPCRR